MSLEQFYTAFWSALAATNPALGSNKAPWPHTNSNTYRGSPIPGTRIYGLVNFKERYAGRHTGRGSRDLCVSYYTDHRDDAAWRALLRRLEIEGSPIREAETVVDRTPGKHSAAQVLFVHRRVVWSDAQRELPSLARWAVEGHANLMGFASEPVR